MRGGYSRRASFNPERACLDPGCATRALSESPPGTTDAKQDRTALPLRGLHLGVFYALAVSQPLLSLLGKNADFFTSRQLTSGKVLLFALGVGLGIPLVLYVIDTIAGMFSDGVGWTVHVVLVAALALLLTAQIARKLAGSTAGAIVVAAVLAGAIAAFYARSAQLRSVVSLFSPLPLLVLALFIFNTPVHKLVFADDALAAGGSGTKNVPVVVVAFDEFTGTSLLGPDNKIDPKLFPNFAGFTKDAAYYRNYTAAADETTRVMAGLLTGSRWKEHALPIAAEYPHNLFTLFGKRYRMRVNEEATNFCPVKLCHQAGASSSSVFKDAGLVYLHQIAPKPVEKKLTPVNETLGKFDEDADEKSASASADRNDANTVLKNLGSGQRPARFGSWLRTIDGNVDRTLYFKHVLLPHVPWQYLPDGRMYRAHAQEYIPNLNQPQSFDDPWLIQQQYQRHLLQAGFADKLIGQLVQRLKQVGIYDKALVVITADNGESFLHLHHDRHIADAVTFTDIASTPLFIKLPNSHSGGYDDRHVTTFDVLPTVAAAAGVKLPWKVDGMSVLRRGNQGPVVVYREQMKKGPGYRISLAAYKQARLRALARKTRLFSHGVYGIGPRPDLIGTTATGLGPPVGRLNPELRRLLAKVKTHSNFVPAEIAGDVTVRGARRGMALALAVNGRIAAVGQSLQLAGDKHVYFNFIVPPEALHDGANTARVYSLSG